MKSPEMLRKPCDMQQLSHEEQMLRVIVATKTRGHTKFYVDGHFWTLVCHLLLGYWWDSFCNRPLHTDMRRHQASGCAAHLRHFCLNVYQFLTAGGMGGVGFRSRTWSENVRLRYDPLIGRTGILVNSIAFGDLESQNSEVLAGQPANIPTRYWLTPSGVRIPTSENTRDIRSGLV